MALTLLAHLFLLQERLHNAKELPLLSCQDIVTMLAFYLPKRDVTEEEVFRQLCCSAFIFAFDAIEPQGRRIGRGNVKTSTRMLP